MSQFILDDQLFTLEVQLPLARWTTVQRLRDVRPGEVIKDERVPVILRNFRQPTFVTIDMAFWASRLRDLHYCLLAFPLSNEEQYKIPGLLRRLLRVPGFATKRQRMGKVVKIGYAQVHYWQLGDEQLHSFFWSEVGS